MSKELRRVVSKITGTTATFEEPGSQAPALEADQGDSGLD